MSSVTVRFSKDAFKSPVSQKMLNKAIELAAEDVIFVISDRTKRGIDLNGGEFAAYDPGYAAWKSRNYPAEGWLQLRGDMLRNIRTWVKKGLVVVGWESARDRLKAIGNSIKRPFFGVTRKELKGIVKNIEKHLGKLAK